ncbi:MAG: fibronectin type III domain-containing protein [Acidimicrobiales bacterium]
MVEWSEQQPVGRTTAERGRRGRHAAVVAVTATLMLLVGLVSPVAAVAPDAPTGSAIPQPAALTANIAWTPAATGDPATSFVLTYTPAVAGAPAEVAASPVSISGLAPGTTYTVDVAAKNADGTSAPLSRTFTTHNVPGAPTIGTATRVGTTTSATVAFSAPANNGGSAITDYEVSVDAGGWTSSGSTSSPITVNGLAVGAQTFRVRAVNAIGTGAASAASNSVDITAPPSAPAAPNLTSATGGENQATIVFTAGATNGATVSGYQVTFTATGGGAVSKTVQVGAAGSHTVPALVAGTYSVAVTALATPANSPASNSRSITVTAAPSAPSAPNLTSATGGENQATIAFTAGATNGATVSGYQVTFTATGGGAVSKTVQVGAAGSHTVPALVAGTYSVAVTALATPANSPASNSRSITVTAPLAKPGTPGTPNVTNSGSTINVSWTAASGTVDNYFVELDRSGQATQTRTVAGTSASFANQSPGDYTITVTARNAAGDGLPRTSSSR